MKRLTLPLAALLVGLGACSSAPPAAAPTSAPAARPGAEAPRAPVLQGTLTSVPERWWLLDARGDGVHGIGVERAYREVLAGRAPEREVIVAVIDSGVDVEHEDLAGSLWVNPGEVPGSGRDDDGNGYVDDVHGWNFIGGPDGRNVNHDTYEVTRLYARLRPLYQGARADTLTAEARSEYEQYQRVRAEWESERAEALRQLRQLREIDAAIHHFTGLLRVHLATDSLTIEQVRAIRTTRADVRQAQSVYLEMAAHDITPELVARQREHLEGRVEYGFNPDFDPRPIVGDDPADLTERFYGNPDVIGPDANHGTHVAGIIAAGRENDLGIDGIAPARIMVVRAVPNGDERDKDVANAIRYAVDNGAHIINMSFGKGHSPEKHLVDEAVRYADSRGVLLVHAAGNDGSDLGSKANFPSRQYLDGGSARNWITVGASAWWAADSLAARFSNYGRDQVDLFAPGVDILSSVPGNGYERNSGTSMAAPVVSGVAALLMAYYADLSAADVKELLLESAVRFPEQRVRRPGERGGRIDFCDLSRTCGVVNAYHAVRLAEERVARRRAAMSN